MALKIIDHRKDKNKPVWAVKLLMNLRANMKPYLLFDETVIPDINTMYNVANTVLSQLLENNNKHFYHIPRIDKNIEETLLQIYDNNSNLIIEIIKEEPTIYGYARVSTGKQNLSLQMEALKNANCNQIAVEKVSALSEDRPELENLLKSLKSGDTFVVWKLDRLGRSMFELINIVNNFEKSGINFISLTEKINTSDTMGKLMLSLFSFLAEYELKLRKERTEAGRDLARKAGRIGGRPKGISNNTRKVAETVVKMYQTKDENGKFTFSVKQIAKLAQISTKTVYKCLELHNISKGDRLTI